MRVKSGLALLACLTLIPLLVNGRSTSTSSQSDTPCATCHEKETPQAYRDWKASKHGEALLDCSICHGTAHQSATDVAKAQLPTPETCATCHEDRVKQYQDGKHALAWIAMNAMPTTAAQPREIMEGKKGCGGCHRVGVQATGEGLQYRTSEKGYGGIGCDACHTRHKFSVAEAKKPEACLPCHMGFDHPQWEMWSTSKHGVLYQIEGPTGRMPTCQTCHMVDGNHRVMTSWGFLGVRLPEEDAQWMKYRTKILQGMQVLDAKGHPTGRLDVVKGGKVARLTQEEWQAERTKMREVCYRCHSEKFANEQLAMADSILKDADALMAEAITLVEDLYRDGYLEKPKDYTPVDLLRFYEVNTAIEEDLYLMFLEYRMRTFQGAFHMNPDYMHWYGWAPMKETLVRMKEEAARLRAGKKPARAKGKLRTGTTK